VSLNHSHLTSTSRGYHLHGVQTGLYSNCNTRRGQRGRGFQPVGSYLRFSAPVSSFTVLLLRLQGMLECVFFLSMYG
jgi:hypothetical protein